MSATLPPHIDEAPVGVRRTALQLVCWPCSASLTAARGKPGEHYLVRTCNRAGRRARAKFLRVHRRCGFL